MFSCLTNLIWVKLDVVIGTLKETFTVIEIEDMVFWCFGLNSQALHRDT